MTICRNERSSESGERTSLLIVGLIIGSEEGADVIEEVVAAMKVGLTSAAFF